MVLRLLALASVLVAAQGASTQNEGSPIGKVVQMLQGMLTKGKALKIDEKAEFAKFRVYCGSSRKETQKAIAKGVDNIMQQTADMGKALTDAEAIGQDIKEEQSDMFKKEAELASATALRKKERRDFVATHKEFSASIAAIAKARHQVGKAKDVPQNLLQVQSSSLIPAQDKATIQAFLDVSGLVDNAKPKVRAYRAQSMGVVGILQKLKIKFQAQRTTLEKEEAGAKAAFELLQKRLKDSIKDCEQTVADKGGLKAKRLETAASTKGDLDITKTGKAADDKKLSDLNTECDTKAREYDRSQVTRADEIVAIETAVGILDSDTVSGAAKKHKMVLLEDIYGRPYTVSALLQFNRFSQERQERDRLVEFLQARAKSSGSKYLSFVAARALADPMGKVKRMIKELIVKLLEEANAEADNKGWCDDELRVNGVTRKHKTTDVDELTAEVEKLTADVSKMTQDIAELTKETTGMRRAQGQATDLYNQEKATNHETIAEAKAAQVAVTRALQVLKEMYGMSSKSSLLQSEDSDSMDEEMKEATGASTRPFTGSGKNKVMTLMEVILTDFAKLEASTSSNQDESAEAYKKFMTDTRTAIEVKGVEIDHMDKKKQRTGDNIRSLKKELKATQKELDTALDYYMKLRPDCVATGDSYKDRVQLRQGEIQSLQEAIGSLSPRPLYVAAPAAAAPAAAPAPAPAR